MEALRNARVAIGAIHPALDTEGFWQLVRFALGGLGVTVLAATVYSAAVILLAMPPLAANAVSWVFGVAASYTVHSRWSFAADKSRGEGGMIGRFLIVAGLAFGLNSLWVWLMTGLLGLHPLAPVPAMVFVTPFASFLLNRFWVFKAA